jgi:hypothetical protein
METTPTTIFEVTELHRNAMLYVLGEPVTTKGSLFPELLPSGQPSFQVYGSFCIIGTYMVLIWHNRGLSMGFV